MNKYEIISFHLKGMSIREISRVLGISRNTITKYIEKYEHDISSLMDESQTISQRAIIESIVEEPSMTRAIEKLLSTTKRLMHYLIEF